MKTVIFLFVIFCAHVALSKEVYYELTISYFPLAPDGVPKQVLGFNGQFPSPTLRASRYDWLRIKVTNLIQDRVTTTTIHWHGMEQFLSPFQDGPRMLTQCDIPYNASFTYHFQANQSGTYWYHAHHTAQYAEGLWGVLIIDNEPEVYSYDGEFLLTLSEWYHTPESLSSEWYQNSSLSRGGLPYPDSNLINGFGYYPCEFAVKKNTSCVPEYSRRYRMLEVERGKIYRIRVVNPATVTLYFFSIDGHKLETIETDGVDTVRVPGVDWLTISTGTRNSFLVKMDGEEDQYWIRAFADLATFKLDYPNITPFPEAFAPTVLAVLRYKTGKNEMVSGEGSINPGASQGRPDSHGTNWISSHPMGPPEEVQRVVNGFEFYPEDPMNLPIASLPLPTTSEKENGTMLNFMDCAPFGGITAPSYVNQTIVLYIPHIDDPDNSGLKPGFNNITYSIAGLDKPAFFKMLNNETLPANLNPIEINGFGEDYVVELIINDFGDSGHPFHLHGHTFWVMGRGLRGDGPFDEERDRPKLRSGVRRETIAVNFQSWLVLRFRADNPGVWLFHCHMNFHFESALGLVFVEGVDVARDLFMDRIPQETKDLCRLSGIEI